MTHYDKLMDAIKDQLYSYYVSGVHNDGWDEADAHETSRMILETVEEFQQKRANFTRWRASD